MAEKDNMVEHHAAVTVNAPVHQVFSLFTHFNDFPKFMSFVKEVTYYDEQRSHWVAEVVGEHQWDAVNENWLEDQQIAWRSYNGLDNTGKVLFQPTGANQTHVDVYVDYDPPAGVLGDIGEKLGAGSRFQNNLQHDLDNFARMVDQAPPGALDPESSNYLFHSGSAAAKGTTTDRQDATMDREPTVGSSTTTTPGGTYSADTPRNTVPTAGGPYNTGPTTNTTPTAGDTYATGTPYNRDASSGGGIVTDRPIMDQDIINEPINTAPTTGSNTGTQDAGINRNPVMPPDTRSTGADDVVMPRDTNNPDPDMTPERDTNKGS
jgi:uncharacterized membrane protein